MILENIICVRNKQKQSSQCLSTILLLLLGGHTHRLAEAARGLGVLSTHLQVPVVAQTAVRSVHHALSAFLPHLLQTVEILTEIGLEVVGDHLAVLSGLNVLLSVQEPLGDIELQRSGDHSDQLLNLIVRQLSGTTRSALDDELATV